MDSQQLNKYQKREQERRQNAKRQKLTGKRTQRCLATLYILEDAYRDLIYSRPSEKDRALAHLAWVRKQQLIAKPSGKFDRNQAPRQKRVRIYPTVLEALEKLEIKSLNKEFIVQYKGNPLDKKSYWKLDEVMELLGGNWSVKDKGFVFSKNPKIGIDSLIEFGHLFLDHKFLVKFPWLANASSN